MSSHWRESIGGIKDARIVCRFEIALGAGQIKTGADDECIRLARRRESSTEDAFTGMACSRCASLLSVDVTERRVESDDATASGEPA